MNLNRLSALTIMIMAAVLLNILGCGQKYESVKRTERIEESPPRMIQYETVPQ